MQKQSQQSDRGLTKYDRLVRPKHTTETGGVYIDVYDVILAFNVTCPARQHAIKKLLCAGLRGKGDVIQDLEETKVALDRAIHISKQEEV